MKNCILLLLLLCSPLVQAQVVVKKIVPSATSQVSPSKQPLDVRSFRGGVGINAHTLWQTDGWEALTLYGLDFSAEIPSNMDGLSFFAMLGPSWDSYSGDLSAMHSSLGIRHDWETTRFNTLGLWLAGEFFTGEMASAGASLTLMYVPNTEWLQVEYYGGYGVASVLGFKEGFQHLKVGVLLSLGND